MPNTAPQPEGQANAGFEAPTTLARLDAADKRLDDIENNTRHNRKSLGIVQNTNWLIIIVLFVALLALVFAAIYQFTGAIKADTASRSELTKTINELRVEVKVLQETKQRAQTQSVQPAPAAP